jgi:hypothetical protein
MIQSFDFLSASAGAEYPQAVMGGIAQVLTATATGLTIAIATPPPYNAFSARAMSLTSASSVEPSNGARRETEEAGTRLEIVFCRLPPPLQARPASSSPPGRLTAPSSG